MRRDGPARGRARGGELAVWLEPVPVRDWMRAPVTTIRVDSPVSEAAQVMRAQRIRHLPVLDGDGRLVGIVTDRDLRQVVFDAAVQERLGALGQALEHLLVRDVMTWGVLTVRPESDIRQAAALMHERKIGALPVVEGARVVGILTETDVLRAFRELLGHLVRRVRPLRQPPPGGGTYDYGFEVKGGEV